MANEITTLEEALAAVKHDGLALDYVPYSLRTAQLCMEAVQQNAFALQFVPEEFQQKIKDELGIED